MLTAKEAKEMMPDAHIKFKRELLDFTVKEIEKTVRSSVDRFKTTATVKIHPTIRNEVIELLKKNGYTIEANGPDELVIDWTSA